MSQVSSPPPALGLLAKLCFRRGDLDLDVELAVKPGETLALVGPNGAGKSTMLELLAGLTPTDAGAIRLGETLLDDPEEDVFVPTDHRAVGAVFHDHLLFNHLSARDNVAFGLRCRGVRRANARRQADHLLATFGLASLATRRPSELSGGQAQRVALARALATKPALLLLDEPLSALDVETRREVRRLLGDQLAAFAGPAIVVTHDPTDAMLLADRIAVVEHGRITQIGTIDEIRRHPATRYAATLVGTNLLDGVADGTTVELNRGNLLTVADGSQLGPVRLTIRPEAISLHPQRPVGSQRNVWQTTVDVVESMGDTTRVTLGEPIALAVDVTTAAAVALSIAPGNSVWAAVKATEVSIQAT